MTSISSSSSPSIGIDLGTTNSLLANFHQGQPEIITNQEGDQITPSIVSFSQKNNEVIVGKLATEFSVAPQNEIFAIKRIIGRRFNDIQEDIKHFPFKVKKNNETNGAIIEIPIGSTKSSNTTIQKTPEEISSLVLRKLKHAAQDRLGERYNGQAVITVPAYFNNAQRVATKKAAELAGIEVLSLLNEPTAAALHYIFDKEDQFEQEKTILVYDFGGGTFDISLMNLSNKNVNVLAVDGDTHLGGIDIDEKILNIILDRINEEFQLDLRCKLQKSKENQEILSTFRRLRTESETLKKSLSFRTKADFYVSPLTADIEEFDFTITREMMPQHTDEIFQRTITIVKKCLAENNKTAKDIDSVLLIGGSSRIPRIHELLSDLFGEAKLCRSQNPDEAVALGASIYAAKQDKTPALTDFHLRDVLSNSLGTDIKYDEMSFILKRNQPLPCECTKVYSTVIDYQTDMLIRVYEGESDNVLENRLLDTLTLTGITRAAQGEVKVSIRFKVDTNGILDISAFDQFNSVRKELRIQLA